MAREALSGLWAKGLLANGIKGGQLYGTGSLGGLQVLFEDDTAEVTPAVTRGKVGAARNLATKQPAQGPTSPPTQPAPSIQPPPPPPQSTEGVPPQ